MKGSAINKYFVILSLLILFHVLNNVYFLINDNTPLVWDNYDRYENSINNYNQLKQGNFSSLINQYISFYDAPLVSYPSFILYPLFGTSGDVTAFQGTIFLIMLIIATYLLGKELFSKDVGLLSAVLVSFSPFVLAFSKVPYDDLAFAAMFTLTLYFFVKSDRFSNIKYTWLFNISLGLTLLSKINAVFTLVFVGTIYLISNLIFSRKEFSGYFPKWSKRNISHFLLSFLFSILIPVLFYITMPFTRLKDVYEFYNIDNFGLFNFSNLLPSILNYFKTLNLNFEYFFIFIIFIISLIFFLIYSKRNKLLIISLIVAANLYHIAVLYFFTFNLNLVPRYLLFIKPFYMIIVSIFLINYLFSLISKLLRKIKIESISKNRYTLFLIIILIILLVPSTLIFNYTSILAEPIKLHPNYGIFHPSQLNYDFEDTFGDIIKNSKNGNQRIFVICPMNNYVVAFHSYIKHYHNYIEVIAVWTIDYNIKFKLDFEREFLGQDGTFQIEHLKDFDYIITEKISHQKNLNTYYNQILEYIQKNKDEFVYYKKIEPDDTKIQLIIYKVNN